MFEKEAAKTLLDGFKPIPHDAWKHDETMMPLTKDEEAPETGFCVGHLAGFFLTDNREYCAASDCRIGVNYHAGIDALTKLFVSDNTPTLIGLLNAHGAPSDPFGERVWEVDPYNVLRDICKDEFGYDYEGELLEFMVPDGLFSGEAICEAVVVDAELEPVLA